MATRRPFQDVENDIIRSGARSGLGCTAIMRKLKDAGHIRSASVVGASGAYREGRVDYDRARKKAVGINRDASLRAKAAKEAAASPTFTTTFDQIVYAQAKAGASLDQIADALQAKGCGSPSLTTINQSAAYREGRGLALRPRTTRPWSAKESEIITEGARRGLTGPAILKALTAAGFERGVRCVTASQIYKQARQLWLDDVERDAAKAAELAAVQAAPQVAPVSRGFVTRYSGVSLPYLPFQKGFGEVVAR
ncbi:hypothetical protein [Aureimonas sp. D3]|uniref:hypothetical protein n=1 Tax=Aureimonas sp. D3 TaxID=1638164 RepID=UPI00078507DB|nr:hypothetical protein [Aureimonas sp. D3]